MLNPVGRSRALIAGLVLLGSPAPTVQARLEVAELWSTKGDRANPFGDIAGMVEARSGLILVSDQTNAAVHSIDPATHSVRQVLRSGSGPGEVRTPALFALTPAGEVALWDVGHNVLIVFDEQLRESRRIPIRQAVYNPKGFTFLPDSSFILSGGSFRSDLGIHHYSSTGAHLHSWLPAPDAESRSARVQLAGAPVSTLANGEVLFTRPAPHLVAKVDPSTGRITPIAEAPDILPPIGDDFEQRRMVGGRAVIAPQWFYPQSRAVFELKDGSILNVITRRYDDQSTWEIYRPGGQLQARRTIQRAYHPYGLTRDGRILASYVAPQTDESVAVLLELSRQ